MLEFQWSSQSVATHKEYKESSKNHWHQNTIPRLCHAILALATAGLTLSRARIAVDQDVSLEPFWYASRHSGFFYQTFDGFRAHALGCVLFKKIDDLSYISRMLFEIVLCFILFFVCQLGRTATSFFVIESRKMMWLPGIKPIVDSDTIHGEDRRQCGRVYALVTQQNTMGTLPNTMMLTLFINSMEQAASFWA